MRIEVLVATMHQTDFTKIEEMNIQSDVLFANQSDNFSYNQIQMDNGFTARMITTPERGVGKNRNTAFIHGNGDIYILSDDDMVFYDAYTEKVASAFSEVPKADMLIFNLENIGEITRNRRINKKIKRVRFFNSLNYGAGRIVIKKSVVEENNLWFSHLFGGGAKYDSGEDTLFICDALKKKVEIYTYPVSIAGAKQDISSWFRGYDDKYFIDKGLLFSFISPKWHKILCLQDALRHYKIYNKKIFETYRLMQKWKYNK